MNRREELYQLGFFSPSWEYGDFVRTNRRLYFLFERESFIQIPDPFDLLEDVASLVDSQGNHA
jgi:hypothetical protein